MGSAAGWLVAAVFGSSLVGSIGRMCEMATHEQRNPANAGEKGVTANHSIERTAYSRRSCQTLEGFCFLCVFASVPLTCYLGPHKETS